MLVTGSDAIIAIHLHEGFWRKQHHGGSVIANSEVWRRQLDDFHRPDHPLCVYQLDQNKGAIADYAKKLQGWPDL